MEKHNQTELMIRQTSKQNRYALRKLSIGVASVMVGMVFMGGQQLAHAAITPAGASMLSAQVKLNQPANPTGNQAGKGQDTTTSTSSQDTARSKGIIRTPSKPSTNGCQPRPWTT